MSRRGARILGLLIAAVAVTTGTAGPADATLTNNTFAPTGQVRPGGHAATVGLVIGCEVSGTFTVEVTVHQGDAFAVGRQHGRCTGRSETYDLVVTTADGPTLRAGPARICGDAATRRHGGIDDTHTWCRADGIELASP